jgi:hypothetical protein
MLKGIAFAVSIMVMSAAAITSLAQNSIIVPGAPAPVPLPPPPAAAGPQPPGAPPRLDTFSDRVSRCLHHGTVQGLQPGARDAYTRACANN